MRLYCIAVQGDNDGLHQRIIETLVQTVEQEGGLVYRAWMAEIKELEARQRAEQIIRVR